MTFFISRCLTNSLPKCWFLVSCDHGPGLARSSGLVVLLTDLVGIIAFKRPSQTADERPSPAFVRFSIQNATRHYASALSGCSVGFETFFPKPRAIETRGAKMIEKALHMGVAKKNKREVTMRCRMSYGCMGGMERDERSNNITTMNNNTKEPTASILPPLSSPPRATAITHLT